jgi:hypothetical protein
MREQYSRSLISTCMNTCMNSRISRRTRCFFLIINLVIGFLAFSLASAVPSQANTSAEASALLSRHPNAGIWVMYKGNNSVADLQQPYIRGIMAYAPWNVTYMGQNEFDWETLDAELDFIINEVGKPAMVDIPAGYCPNIDWPAWIREEVATYKEKNENGCHPFQFWDPTYIDLHKAYIRALANHLADFDSKDTRPAQTDITFVRAEVMAKTMENLPNDDELSEWTWRNFNSAPNGRIYEVDLTKELKYSYQEEITLTYKRELDRAYAEVGLTPPVPAAKGGNYWRDFPTRDRFVSESVWLDQHSGSPNPQGWYYDMYSKVRSGETRGASETGGKSPETLLAQYAYWEVLANLHYGVEFIGLYGNNKFSPQLQPKGAVSYLENREALEFGTRYAGAYRAPATSPGAWIALRGGYPEESFSGKVYARRMWTNYEFLMTQYRPQQSVLLFGIDHNQGQTDSLTPIVKRSSKKPWRNEIDVCQKEFPARLCEYLWQQPSKYLGKRDDNHEYTYRMSDLGKVVYCGVNMFCGDEPKTTRVETILWARRTNDVAGFPFMRFDLDDKFAQSLNGRAQIRVVYLDQGRGQWELRYDSQSEAGKLAIVVKKHNSNQWKEVVVDVNDAAFNNGLEGRTDLSLFNMNDDDDIFHMIEVLRVETEE